MFTLNDAKIELPKYSFSPGETINGKVITYLPKPTNVNEIKLNFYGLYIPPDFRSSGEDSGIIFAKQDIILARDSVCQSYMYDFKISIPPDIYPEEVSNSLVPQKIFSSGWEKIRSDVISELLGKRQLSPGFRFFIDLHIDIPWGEDLYNSIEVTINPHFH